jgi:hypothetical protein
MGGGCVARYIVREGSSHQPAAISVFTTFHLSRCPEKMRADGRRFDGVNCSIVLEWVADSTVLVQISGTDAGELGDAPTRIRPSA